MSFGEERCSSYMLIPPQNHDPAARKRRENLAIDAVQTIAGAGYKPVSSRLQYVFTSQVMRVSAEHVHSLFKEFDRIEPYNLSRSEYFIIKSARI